MTEGTVINLPPDFVQAFDTASDFPAAGVYGIIYASKATGATYAWNGSTYVSAAAPSSIDASAITSGIFDIARIPPAALERVKVVADQTARYALTTSDVQNGDCVYQNDTQVMYWVIDDTNLGNSSGYRVYAAGTAAAVAWSGVTGKPSWTGQAADASHDGYLTQGDWATFNGKQAAGSYLTTATKLVDIVPETSGTAAAAGKIGEIISSTVSTSTTTGVGASAQWGDVTSISLTNGEWIVYGLVGYTENSSVMTGSFALGGGTASGNSSPSLGNYVILPYMSQGLDSVQSIPAQYVSVSGGTISYYLKSKFSYSSGTPKHYGKIWAVRVR